MNHKLLLNRCSFSYKAKHTQTVFFAVSAVCLELNLRKFKSHTHGQCVIHKNITSLAHFKGNECVSQETKKTCRISWSNNKNKRDEVFCLRTCICALGQCEIYNSVWGQERECENVSLSVFLLFIFSFRCVSEKRRLSQINSLKAMMTFQRTQSPYALTWISEKQTTNVMHDCTWQADMVGKFSCVVCDFEVMQICGESAAVKIKTLFCCWEPLGERAFEKCRVTQDKTNVEQMVVCLFSRSI